MMMSGLLRRWLFQPSCGLCRRPSPELICGGCWNELPRLVEPLCPGCMDRAPGWCSSCWAERPPWISMTALFKHDGGVRTAIHRIKYRHGQALAHPLGQALGAHCHKIGWTVDAVVPVPLDPQRKWSRGYNQAEWLARPVAHALGVPLRPRVLERNMRPQQMVLSGDRRLTNLANAVKTRGAVPRDVLLIDDVATTGATLKVCTRALLEGGARSVRVAVLARTVSRRGEAS